MAQSSLAAIAIFMLFSLSALHCAWAFPASAGWTTNAVNDTRKLAARDDGPIVWSLSCIWSDESSINSWALAECGREIRYFNNGGGSWFDQKSTHWTSTTTVFGCLYNEFERHTSDDGFWSDHDFFGGWSIGWEPTSSQIDFDGFDNQYDSDITAIFCDDAFGTIQQYDLSYQSALMWQSLPYPLF
jgi:hypothetical protein